METSFIMLTFIVLVFVLASNKRLASGIKVKPRSNTPKPKIQPAPQSTTPLKI